MRTFASTVACRCCARTSATARPERTPLRQYSRRQPSPGRRRTSSIPCHESPCNRPATNPLLPEPANPQPIRALRGTAGAPAPAAERRRSCRRPEAGGDHGMACLSGHPSPRQAGRRPSRLAFCTACSQGWMTWCRQTLQPGPQELIEVMQPRAAELRRLAARARGQPGCSAARPG